ncbi:MAG TPA: polysaccharide biosynthesis tyrosine autokinase, partial [Thermoleophilia bacterium]|nr:polysaccharide biosynthesis tyrosine autokinase [Thermoleophilia bacterium]
MNELVRRPGAQRLAAPVPAWREPSIREDDALDARHLASLLLKRKWHVVFVMMLVVVPAVVATLLQQKLYSATTFLQVDPEPMQLLPNGNVDVPRPVFDIYMKTLEQILNGTTLLSRMERRLTSDAGAPGMAQESSMLTRRYSAARLENTQMLRVTYLAPQPEVAAKIANMFADEFMRLQFEGLQSSRDNARLLLERDLAKAERQIQLSERELVLYSQQHEVEGARPDRRSLADDRLVAIAGQTFLAETEVATARARVQSLESASIVPFPATLMNDVLSSRLSAMLQLEHELTALRTTFGENWPGVVQKRDEIAKVREQLDREKETVLEQARAQAAMDLRAAQAKLQSATSSRTNQEGRVNELQTASVQYNILQRNVETNRKLYEGLLERLKQLSVAPGMDLGSIRVIEPAIPDSTVASPRLLWNGFLAVFLGLALGVSFVLGHDYWTNAFSNIEDLENFSLLPVLGAIPLVRPRSGGRLSSMAAALRFGSGGQADSPSLLPAPSGSGGRIALGADAESAEAVRSLCASLLLSKSERPPRVVVVTSALPGEGKTTISAELGRALAESGARTLLVEGDMRRPQLSHLFGVDMEGGLSLFLAGQSPEVTVHATSLDGLSVVSAG